MRILQINDANCGGGAEIVFSKTSELLRKKDYNIQNYTPDKVLKNPLSYVFSVKHFFKLKEKILAFSPKVVHLHNYYHNLSPSVLFVLKQLKKKLGFKVVMTVHDYHLLCANNGFFRWDGSNVNICEDCTARRYSKIILNNCDRRGICFSFLKYFQHLIAYKIFRWDEVIDYFIVPSEFLRKKLSSFASSEKIKLVHHPIFITEKELKNIKEKAKKLENKFESIYIGRISPEKGLHHFLKEDYKKEKFGNFGIIGDGDESYKKELKKICTERNIKNNIYFLGKMSHEECMTYLSKSETLIFPSKLYETFGLAALEAKFFNKKIFHYGLEVIDEILNIDKDKLCQDYYIKNIEKIYR